MNIAVIPARGGSKRVPRKNVRSFCGKPMIGWSIEAAQASGIFEHILVSTDDEEIAAVAKAHGAEVPFMRPVELSGDHTGTMPVVAHAMDSCFAQGWSVDAVCCIYATAPFLKARDLQLGLQILVDHAADVAFSVTSYAFPIQRALRITEQGRVAMFQPEHFNTRSQDLEEAWHDAGQFYWGVPAAWRAEQSLFARNAVPVKLPRSRVQDIDTPDDWLRAEWIFKEQQAAQL